MKFEHLSSEHDRSSFDCGKEPLNDYLKKYALQNEKRHNSRTFVLVPDDGNRVLGYYTTTVKSLEAEHVPESLGGFPMPVALLARLAVDSEFHGQGLGRLLLVDALKRVVQAGSQVGIRAIEVDAIDEDARSFYLKYGFQRLQDDRLHMYLPMKALLNSGLAATSGGGQT